jgi:hypothetical protein
LPCSLLWALRQSAFDALKALTSSKSSSAPTPASARPCRPVRLLSSNSSASVGSGLRLRRRLFADIAGDHERAARCAEPVLAGIGDDGIQEPLRAR